MTNAKTNSNYQLIKVKHYQTFDSVAEMNATVRVYNKQLKKSHYETLKLLSQYSCKVVGVSHLKIETIANKLDKSVSTVKRHLAHLKNEGMITVVNTSRIKMGGKGANVYVINPLETQQKIKNDLSKKNNRKDSKKQAQTLARKAMDFVKVRKETIKILSYINSLSNNGKRKAHLKRIDSIKNARIKPDNMPTELYNAYQPFFTDDQLATLYNTITNKLVEYNTLEHDQHAEIIETVFKSIVRRLRKQYRNEADPLNNMFAFAIAVTKKQANTLVNRNMFNFLFA